MADENKPPQPPSKEDLAKAANPAGSGTPDPSTPATAKPTGAEPAAASTPSAVPPKPAAPAAATPAKPAAPAKPAGPVPQPWDSPMVAKLKRQFGTGLESWTYLNQNYFQVDRSLIPTVLQLLRDEEKFDYCVDVTAVHYPKRERQFDIVWILYSFERNERLRVKTQIADGEHIPSVASLWATANWLEREAFDMFGIQFDGHPDLKRILLPDGWKGHPLRKDYGIIQQDDEWVQINLGIPSGQ
jgi:NADH-quinone oxidoreductase subunit C